MTITPPPEGPDGSARPIRVGRVFIGIGVSVAAYVIVGCLVPLLANRLFPEPAPVVTIAAPLVLFVAALVVGVIQVVRGDRGIGVGLLIGGALIPIILAGVCVALILSVAGSGAFG
jgi:hypothetical protein